MSSLADKEGMPIRAFRISWYFIYSSLFNALDELLEFLYAHIAEYPEFASSQAYQDRKSAIVRSTADVNDVCFINGSRIVFLRLQPHLKFAEEMLLQPAIGDKLYEHLIDGLVNPPEDEEARKSMERLRLACSRYIVAMAVRRLLMETGSVTDRGCTSPLYSRVRRAMRRRDP